MSHTPHQLPDEFPEFAKTLQALKQVDAHFAKLVDQYDEANQKIHLAETNVTPMDDIGIIELRKERMALKDDIAARLKSSAEA